MLRNHELRDYTLTNQKYFKPIDNTETLINELGLQVAHNHIPIIIGSNIVVGTKELKSMLEEEVNLNYQNISTHD